MSTHQIHEVESLADHIGALRDGKLVAQMSLDDLQRTVRRYQFEVPAMWQAPRDLQVAGARRGGAGPEMQWTVVGEERVVIDRLAAAGARVRDVRALTLEDAAIALLTEEVAP
jgi:ABC-2 type transport system ATP-binding protein